MPQIEDIRDKRTRARISNVWFYIPFGYYYVVRLGTTGKLLSWMLIYLMPTLWYSMLTYQGNPWVFAVNYMLVLIAAFSLYELGYIFNDTTAILREEQPAIRLYDYNFRHFELHKTAIVVAHVGYAIAAMVLLAVVFRHYGVSDAKHIGLTCGCIVLILPLFALYNRWRSTNNVWLYPLLVCSRYMPFLLLYNIDALAITLLLLSFPLVNWLERFSMPKYRFPFMRRIIPTEQSKTLFRVAYYVIVVCVLLLIQQWLPFSYSYMIPVFILCLYRMLLSIIVIIYQPKNYLNG